MPERPAPNHRNVSANLAGILRGYTETAQVAIRDRFHAPEEALNLHVERFCKRVAKAVPNDQRTLADLEIRTGATLRAGLCAELVDECFFLFEAAWFRDHDTWQHRYPKTAEVWDLTATLDHRYGDGFTVEQIGARQSELLKSVVKNDELGRWLLRFDIAWTQFASLRRLATHLRNDAEDGGDPAFLWDFIASRARIRRDEKGHLGKMTGPKCPPSERVALFEFAYELAVSEGLSGAKDKANQVLEGLSMAFADPQKTNFATDGGVLRRRAKARRALRESSFGVAFFVPGSPAVNTFSELTKKLCLAAFPA